MRHHSIDKFTLPITTIILVCAVCYYYATQYEIFNRYDKYTKKTERKNIKKWESSVKHLKLTKVDVSKSFDIFFLKCHFSQEVQVDIQHTVFIEIKNVQILAGLNRTFSLVH